MQPLSVVCVTPDACRLFTTARPLQTFRFPALTDEAPRYERPMAEPRIQSEPSAVAPGQSTNYTNDLLTLLSSGNITSKQWVYRQYDHMVRTNTAILPGADAAVVRIKETRRALAMTLDGNGRYCAANPREARSSSSPKRRATTCAGARPIAIHKLSELRVA